MTASLQDLAELPQRPLRRSEYDQLVAAGAFEDERIELLYGRLVAMSPLGAAHAWLVRHLTRRLMEAVGAQAAVSVQAPIDLTDHSEPKPDLAVIPLEEDRPDTLPCRAHVVIEVADSSRRTDLGIKAGLYAEAGVPAYWVFDVSRRHVVVHERPDASGSWTEVRRIDPEASGALTIPGVGVAVRIDGLLGALPG